MAKHPQLKTCKADTPRLFDYIMAFDGEIRRDLEIINWVPQEHLYSCVNLNTVEKVSKRKDEIWNSLVAQKDWESLIQGQRDDVKNEIIKNLVGYLTTYTDYLADIKIRNKDLAVCSAFLDPFKWDQIVFHRESLGKSSKLLSQCLASDQFWQQLRDAHRVLKQKNMFSEEIHWKVKEDMEKLFADIQQFHSHIPCGETIGMPYDINALWNKESSLVYISDEGTRLRNS